LARLPRVAAACALLVLAAALPAAPFDVRETPEGVAILTRGFEARFARQAATLVVVREGRTVLDGWAASGPGGAFPKGPGTQTIGALLRATSEGKGVDEAVVLDYATSVKDSVARIEVRPFDDALRLTVRLLVSEADMVPGFAWKLEASGFWYGGGFQGFRDPQVWPLNDASMVRPTFLVSGLSQATPFWYTTGGVGLRVRTPLDFRYSVNEVVDGKADGLLRVSMPLASALEYDLMVAKDVREVVRRFTRDVGYPRRVPPAEYFRLPIYTTWVEHKAAVDQAKVLEFARAIRANDLPAGVLELDDKWEVHYGDMDFDPAKFPDPRAMNDELHRMGFRSTLWVHPFVNPDTRTYAAHRDDGLLLRDATGRAGLIRWWNGPAAVWDFTNPAAAALFRSRLDALMRDFGFDGFKFDGGDVHFVVRDAQPMRPMTAAQYPDLYNEVATAHYGWNETRVGIESQPLGIVQRLIDKNSVWGKENGLAALVPEALTTSLRGFFFLMPDMVGGNQYDGDVIEPELLVRWAQASALMPLLQFSVGPWHHGPEAVRLCREASRLHVAFAPYTYRLAEESTRTGEPILAPLFYHAPDDPETFRITDQFMLGPDVVVAPVVAKGAVVRDVYLPKGRWMDYRTKMTADGGRWLRAYPAPLDVLPVFVREGARVP
jgi:alpha-glucosidase (family GH31 glycosyl hydrolase)